jgi:CubicO group peptidase (beta-lactamase class C family)
MAPRLERAKLTAAIAVVMDGRVALTTVRAPRDAAIDVDSTFALGSLSKFVLAATTMKLVEAGQPCTAYPMLGTLNITNLT